MTLGELVTKIREYNPVADVGMVEGAYEFSAKVHRGQKRLSGEPYLTHPLAVAGIIADMRLDVPTVVTGLLHDTVEDTLTTLQEIDGEFGSDSITSERSSINQTRALPVTHTKLTPLSSP